MAKYANQKTVYIRKEPYYDRYLAIGQEEIALASRVLKPSAFKVWLYIMKNSAGARWRISPRDAELKWGISRSTFHDGLKELKEKGYYNEKEISDKPLKNESEITKKKRKTPAEIRTKNDPKFEKSYDEIRIKESEIQYSNNINNTSKNTASLIRGNNPPPITPASSSYGGVGSFPEEDEKYFDEEISNPKALSKWDRYAIESQRGCSYNDFDF